MNIHKHILFLLIVFFFSVFSCVAVAQTPHPLESVPQNTWIEIPNSQLLPHCYPWPAGHYHGSIYSCAGVFAESGAAYDTTRDQLLLWGGGHRDYAGNEVYALDLPSLTWQRLTTPTLLVDVSGTTEKTGYYPDGSGVPDLQQPRSAHSGNMLQHIPALDSFCVFGLGSTFPNSHNIRKTLCLDRKTLTWSERAVPPGGLHAFTATDASTGFVWQHGTNVAPWLGVYNPTLDKWTQKSQWYEQYNYYQSAVVDPVEHKLVVVPGCHGYGGTPSCPTMPQGYTVDLTSTSTNIPRVALSMVGAEGIATGLRNPGVVYDSLNKKVVAWNGGASVFMLDVATRVWTKVDPASTNTVIPPLPANGTFGRLQYSAKYHGLVLITHANRNVFFYKLPSSTVAVPLDTTPPVVTLSPLGLTGSVPLVATATDDVGIASVTFMLDGQLLGSVAQSPFTFVWDTTTVANGAYIISVSARDAAGNVASVDQTVVVHNPVVAPPPPPPPVDTTPPVVTFVPLPLVLQGTLSLEAQATDDTGVASIEFLLDGARLALLTSTPYTYAWDSTTVADGAHTVTAIARDAVGNVTTVHQQRDVKNTVVPPPPVLPPPNVMNTMTLTNTTSVDVLQYPLQFGRPFVKGEITQIPQPLVDGVEVSWQVNVKTRWSDNSVQHAIFNIIVPKISSGGTVTITFVDRQPVTGGTPVTLNDLLSTSFDALSTFTFSGQSAQTVTARQMIVDGHCTPWLEGDVALSVLCADHSVTRRYDIGSDNSRSVRPSFILTYWKMLGSVYVRFLGDMSHVGVTQDQVYDLSLSLNGTGVYTKLGVPHKAFTRWTRTFWTHPLAQIHVNHNVGYLRETTLLPNYDSTKRLDEATMVKRYTNWQAETRDLYTTLERVGIRQHMGSTDWGRMFGLFWGGAIDWLFAGDARMQEAALGVADLMGQYPVHYREGTVRVDKGGASCLGRWVTIECRPTLYVPFLTDAQNKAADKIVPVAALIKNPFFPDPAHEPDVYSLPYLLTGDYAYLEGLLAWASYGAATVGSSPSGSGGRGPTGTEGGIAHQVRGEAWILRTRLHAATFAPDGHPDKAYHRRLIDGALAIWEGARDLHGSPFDGNPAWTWGRKVASARYSNQTPAPLHFWGNTVEPASNWSNLDQTKATHAIAHWMQMLVVVALGRGKELGYPTETLLTWLGQNHLDQMNQPGVTPYLVGSYRIATRGPNGNFAVWPDVVGSYLPTFNIASYGERQANPASGYLSFAMAATAYAHHLAQGQTSWQWITGRVLNRTGYMTEPTWAILPR